MRTGCAYAWYELLPASETQITCCSGDANCTVTPATTSPSTSARCPAPLTPTQVSFGVLLRQPLRRLEQPRLDDRLLELADTDLLQADEDRRVPVEVRRREIDAGVVGEQRLLRARVLDPGA